MPASAVTIARDFITRFQTDDFEGALELLSDDVVIHECDSLPYPGDHVGKEAFRKFAAAHREVWMPRRHDDGAYRYIDGGPDTAVALARLPVTSVVTGAELEVKAAEIFTVRDGKIVDVEVYYWDTKEIHDATNGQRVL